MALAAQRDLSRAVMHANDSAARARYSCSGQRFAERMTHSQSMLRAVLSGTVASQVQSVVVPASGGDVLTALAAFPAADEIVMISREPAMPPTHHRLASLWEPLPTAALGELKAVFACTHGGGYFLGIQLRAFARECDICID